MNHETQNADDRVAERTRLLTWLGASLTLLLFGGWLTSFGLDDWYKSLKFPPFQPPGWAFSPAWTLILTLLAIATWKITGVAEKRNTANLTIALVLYGIQIALNCGWSLLFFTLKRPDIAMWEIIALDIVLALMIITYWRISKSAGLMLVPYFAWLLFATAINVWIVNNNPSFGM